MDQTGTFSFLASPVFGPVYGVSVAVSCCYVGASCIPRRGLYWHRRGDCCCCVLLSLFLRLLGVVERLHYRLLRPLPRQFPVPPSPVPVLARSLHPQYLLFYYVSMYQYGRVCKGRLVFMLKFKRSLYLRSEWYLTQLYICTVLVRGGVVPHFFYTATTL